MSILSRIPEKSPQNDARMLSRVKRVRAVHILFFVLFFSAFVLLYVYAIWGGAGEIVMIFAAALIAAILLKWYIILKVGILAPLNYASRDLATLCDPEMLERVSREMLRQTKKPSVITYINLFSALCAKGDFDGGREALTQAAACRQTSKSPCILAVDEAALAGACGDPDEEESKLNVAAAMMEKVQWSQGERASLNLTMDINRDALLIKRGVIDGVMERMRARLNAEPTPSLKVQVSLWMNIAECAKIAGDQDTRKEALTFVAHNAPKLYIGQKAKQQLTEMEQ